MPPFKPIRAADDPAGFRCLDLQVGPGLAFRIDGLPTRFFDTFARFLSHFATTEKPDDPILLQAYDRPPDWTPSGKTLFEGDGLRLWETRLGDGAEPLLPGTPPLLVESHGLVGWCEAERTRGGLLFDAASPAGTEEIAAQALVPLLFELALDRGWLGIHAAAVAIGDHGLLMPAPSGSGKSTLFREANRAGFDLLSDDLVWLRPIDDGWWMQPFPRGLPWLRAPDPTIDGVRVAAIVAPSISKEVEHDLQRCSASDLVSVLLPETALNRYSSRAAVGFRRAVALAGPAPGFRPAAGWQQPAIETLRQILNAVARGPGKEWMLFHRVSGK